MIFHGDCLDKLKDLESNSVDSIVTDPPYGLSFMGKKWDYDVPSVEIWRECLRVLKPGGHLLSFAGTRTYHRMACNIEDAGFEIRDQIMWLYGSGFPKSHDVSKAIDKAAGAEREVVGMSYVGGGGASNSSGFKDGSGGSMQQSSDGKSGIAVTAPATEAAKQWQGWGTALKPANEPIVVARKPLEKGLTVAQNVLKYGTGALNIDASRIEYQSEVDKQKNTDFSRFLGTEKSIAKSDWVPSGQGGLSQPFHERKAKCEAKAALGRWPANVLLDEEAAAALDEQSGILKTGGNKKSDSKDSSAFGGGLPSTQTLFTGSSGGASRFFYVAKASKRERNAGLEGMEKKEPPGSKRSTPADGRQSALGAPRENFHPTVKPVKLMEYLIKLVTPANGIVLDPFMGSGTTGVAAKKLKCKFIGIEREKEYKKIAEKRIEAVA